MKSLNLILACFGMLFLSSCDKADDAIPDTQSGSYVNVAPSVSDGAVLVAARSHTTQASPVAGFPDIDISLDIPVGIFFTGGAQVKAGSVSIDGTNLDFVGNIYTMQTGGFTPGSEQFMYDAREWTVSGEGSVTAGTYANTKPLPTLGALTAEATLTRGQEYSISIASVSQADSLIYLIGDQSITVGSRTRSATFTADQTNALSKGTSIAQVAAYNITERADGTRKVYLINEDIRQLTIDVQ